MNQLDDPYVYPGTEVLINLAGLRDPTEADQYERRMSLFRRRELEDDPVHGSFNLAHFQEIHRRLYQDVWAWAGQLRTVEITKGSSEFHTHSLIPTAFGQVTEYINDSGLLSDAEMGDAQFVPKAAELLSLTNFIHPFREGNGRTQRAFLDQIAARTGRTLSWRNVSRIDNDRASIQAFRSASGAPFEPLIREALKPPIDGLSLLETHAYDVAPTGGASAAIFDALARSAKARAAGLCGAPTRNGAPCRRRGHCPYHSA